MPAAPRGLDAQAASRSQIPLALRGQRTSVQEVATRGAVGASVAPSGGVAPALVLTPSADILATISRAPDRPRLVVGFAAETEDVVAHAAAKLVSKGCDWIVANDVSGDVMGGDANAVHLITAAGVEDWPRANKTRIAERLAARIAEALEQPA